MKSAFQTAHRILRQLRNDPRTIAMMLLVPIILMGLLAWIYDDQPKTFDTIGPALLGVFPLIVMFIVTSVATLRERVSGTLERLLTTPLPRGSFMSGYAIAFGWMAVIQAVVATTISVYVYGLDVKGPIWLLVVIAVVDALLGTALGLFASGFARSEFQAVQFMPALILPQLLLCGLLAPRSALPTVLHWISNVLPLSYAVDGLNEVASKSSPDVTKELLILTAYIVVSLALGSFTLRRRTD